MLVLAACLGSLPYTLGPAGGISGAPSRCNDGSISEARLPPSWFPKSQTTRPRQEVAAGDPKPKASFFLGSDVLGRSLLLRLLAGGGVSLCVGFAAAAISVVVGTLWGTIAAYAGGMTDAVMMRIVDVLYGLPSILLIVLLAIAADSMIDNHVNRNSERRTWVESRASEELSASGRESSGASIKAWLATDLPSRVRLETAASAAYPRRELSPVGRAALDLSVLFVAVGGVSWLTMSRVIRGQVLSLKTLPFIDAARVSGASRTRIFVRHLLPNLVGPIVVYATLSVPQAILQESFLSFLGVGVRPPLPSWGTLCADGLPELNPYQSNWWLLLFPCLALATTLILLNFAGEAVRERLDPKRRA
ncbi:MAG: ABC transporter permease [Planctomycetota bacterium]